MPVKPSFPIFRCGGQGEPACPPEPAVDAIEGGSLEGVDLHKLPVYTYNDLLAHGAAQYAKGLGDAKG